MRRVGVVALVTAAAVLTGAGAGASALTLRSGGVVAPLKKAVIGILAHGPCDRFEESGELISNSQPADEARFGSGVHEFGLCEGERVASGSVYHFRLAEHRSSKASMLAKVSISYVTLLAPGAVGEECPYHVKALAGKFAIPGPTRAAVAGTGKRTFPSPRTCPETLRLTGWEATLYDAESGELFEAEAGP